MVKATNKCKNYRKDKEDMRPKFYMLVGLPGSGKSTIATELGGEIFSSDKLFVSNSLNFRFAIFEESDSIKYDLASILSPSFSVVLKHFYETHVLICNNIKTACNVFTQTFWMVIINILNRSIYERCDINHYRILFFIHTH